MASSLAFLNVNFSISAEYIFACFSEGFPNCLRSSTVFEALQPLNSYPPKLVAQV